jgi:hypothetical protein
MPLEASGQAAADSGRSYIIPALEIVGFDAMLNLFDRVALGGEYRSNLASIRRNLRANWVVEHDPFALNQFGHPYQGSMYHGFARTSRQNFWTSLAYAFAGSALWEIAGETTPPSRNDQVASGIAGAFLGEALFRTANLVLETSDGPPAPGRKLVAAAISPPLGFGRRAFGRRFDRLFPSRGAPYYRRIQMGASATTHRRADTTRRVLSGEGAVDISLEYGLPGPSEYRHRRPFDYFAIQATATSASGLESVLLRGLLAGRNTGTGEAWRGIWGLYGLYDFIAPRVFRVSNTALALGTTAEWRPSPSLAVQASALAGGGFAAVGALNSNDTTDYHYGLAPHALVASRLILTNRAALDVSAREYFVSRVAGTSGHDNIVRVEAAFTWRLREQRAIAVRYLLSRRDAVFPGTGNRTQLRGTLGLFYSMLGHDRFGSVPWRARVNSRGPAS